MSEEAERPAAEGERIAKRIARAGLCSRRDAERWITEGRVAVDGVVLTSPALVVGPDAVILVDGKPLPEAEPTRLWRYHKPAGLITSHRDEQGRKTLFEALPAELGRVISVGRLDYNSEGLLLLTNDGELARRLELPATGWVRRYKVRIHGTPDPERLLGLAQGITIDGVRYGPITAEFDRQQGANGWVTVALTEGKNREIRRVFEHLGHEVSRLIRLSYGPFQLGSLARGEVEEVPRRVVRDQLGLGPAGDKGRRPATPTARKTLTLTPKPAEGEAKPARPRRRADGTKPPETKTPTTRTPGTKPTDATRRR